MSFKKIALATTVLATLGTASAETATLDTTANVQAFESIHTPIGKFTHEWDRASGKECVYTFGSGGRFNRGSEASLIKSANTVCPMTITASQLEGQNSTYNSNYNQALVQYYSNPYNYYGYGYNNFDFGPFTFSW
jgi:hypothetical protein